MAIEKTVEMTCHDPVEALLFRRRSIRKYRTEVPPAAWIEAMIACGARAPSPSNSQPVRFVRISSSKIRDNLERTMAQRYQDLLQAVERKGGAKKTRNILNACFRYSEFLFKAPVIVAVGTGSPTGGFSGRLVEAGILPGDARGETDLDISVGLALKGFLIKGEALGLGTCILSAPLVFLTDLERRIGIEDIRIKCFITVGFADETPSFVERKSLAEIYREV